MEFKGMDITNLPPHKMAHLGLRRSFQVITLFPELTALENVRLAIQRDDERTIQFFQKILRFKRVS